MASGGNGAVNGEDQRLPDGLKFEYYTKRRWRKNGKKGCDKGQSESEASYRKRVWQIEKEKSDYIDFNLNCPIYIRFTFH